MQENPMLLDARIDGLYRLVKGRINWDNLIPTCIEVARELEGMTHLRGPERLDLLQKTLRHALKESDKCAEEKEKILFVIDTVIPIAMQAAILASKAPIVNQAVSSCWAFCMKK